MSNSEILVLEDEALIAMDIEMTLAEAGFEQVSVHSNAQSALNRIDECRPMAAFLDFNLGNGKNSLPVAEKLKSHSIPFVFLTGYTDATVSLPSNLSDTKRIAKPFRSADLVKTINEMVPRA